MAFEAAPIATTADATVAIWRTAHFIIRVSCERRIHPVQVRSANLKENSSRLLTWVEPFEDSFGHVAQRGAFRRYLLGLLSDSPRQSWDVAPVWCRLLARGPDRHGVLILDDAGFPKQGTQSVGVQRQYSGTLGKIDNGQVAVTAALWTGVRAWLLGAELYLPASWLTRERHQQAGAICGAGGMGWGVARLVPSCR